MTEDKFKNLEPSTTIHDREDGDEWCVIGQYEDYLRVRCTFAIPGSGYYEGQILDMPIKTAAQYMEMGEYPNKSKLIKPKPITTTVAEAIQANAIQVGDEITITARVMEVHNTGLLITTCKGDSYHDTFILHGFNNIKYTPKQ